MTQELENMRNHYEYQLNELEADLKIYQNKLNNAIRTRENNLLTEEKILRDRLIEDEQIKREKLLYETQQKLKKEQEKNQFKTRVITEMVNEKNSPERVKAHHRASSPKQKLIEELDCEQTQPVGTNWHNKVKYYV